MYHLPIQLKATEYEDDSHVVELSLSHPEALKIGGTAVGETTPTIAIDKLRTFNLADFLVSAGLGESILGSSTMTVTMGATQLMHEDGSLAEETSDDSLAEYIPVLEHSGRPASALRKHEFPAAPDQALSPETRDMSASPSKLRQVSVHAQVRTCELSVSASGRQYDDAPTAESWPTELDHRNMKKQVMPAGGAQAFEEGSVIRALSFTSYLAKQAVLGKGVDGYLAGEPIDINRQVSSSILCFEWLWCVISECAHALVVLNIKMACTSWSSGILRVSMTC
jgi:hypothetical protein